MVLCCDESLRLCMLVATTSKYMKARLVSAAGDGLRFKTYHPHAAIGVELMHGFRVRELVLHNWPTEHYTIAQAAHALKEVFTHCPKLMVVSLGPEHRVKARCMESAVRRDVRAGAQVRARAPVLQAPWQIGARLLMRRWLSGAPPDILDLTTEGSTESSVHSDPTEYDEASGWDDDEAGETYEVAFA
jgi:hypothetical protein